MTKHRPIVPRMTALALTLFLAACGSGLNPFESDTIDAACPPFGALKRADELTRFRPGGGHDLTDVMFQARIDRVAGKCQVTQSKLLADVKTGIAFVVERGPALEADSVALDYFVAIRTPEGAIASRQAFTLNVEFESGARQARAIDYLAFELPNATPEALRTYRIFYGLQMTREEWEFSERVRRRR